MDFSLKKKPVLIFIHIPKTAGTTLRSVLYSNYKRSQIHESYDEKLWYKGVEKDHGGRKWRLVFGHVRYGYDQYLSREFQYATMLRHPVDRLHSHYRHILRSGMPEHNVLKKQYRCFVEFCESPSAYNIQTRMLSGVYDFEEFKTHEYELMEMAKFNLEQMAAFGLSERFIESLSHFSRIFGWQISPIQDLNVDPNNKAELTTTEIVAGRKANTSDLELYTFACSLFEQRIAGMSLK